MKSLLLGLLPLGLLIPLCNASTVSITTPSLPAGTDNASYSAVIQAAGGCTPYKWAVVSGSLPEGITVQASSNTKSFELSGTPSSTGTFSFTVSVTGCGGHVSSVAYQVTIDAPSGYSVSLHWDASSSSDVTGYNVYRGPNGTTWQKINSALVPSTSYADSSVADNNTYYYAVTAVDSSNNESAKTAAVEVNVP